MPLNPAHWNSNWTEIHRGRRYKYANFIGQRQKVEAMQVWSFHGLTLCVILCGCLEGISVLITSVMILANGESKHLCGLFTPWYHIEKLWERSDLHQIHTRIRCELLSDLPGVDVWHTDLQLWLYAEVSMHNKCVSVGYKLHRFFRPLTLSGIKQVFYFLNENILSLF